MSKDPSSTAANAGALDSMFQRLQQLYFDLGGTQSQRPAPTLKLLATPFAGASTPKSADLTDPAELADSLEDEEAEDIDAAESQAEETEDAEASAEQQRLYVGPAPELEQQCREHLVRLGISAGQAILSVTWNARLRSTAGYAAYPSWRIELNPRLQLYPGESQRTLLHELAHLVAYHRAGRRRIEPHGVEWQRACTDLGIPGESPRHRLPLPRNQLTRRLTYQCANCQTLIHRVRPFRGQVACLTCCRQYSGGKFNPRFLLTKVQG